jgi:hypothetical protein
MKMRIKTSELTNAALDWVVAQADNEDIERKQYSQPDDWVWYCRGVRYAPSDTWSQGGPIIEREKIDLMWQMGGRPYWLAETQPDFNDQSEEGPTPLIAAMRCYVASRLGDEVDVPEELINHG